MLKIENLSKRHGNLLALELNNFHISINPYNFFIKT